MIQSLTLAVLFCAQISWAAGVKTTPVKVTVAPISGAAGASFGAASLSLPQTQLTAPSALPVVAPVFSQTQLGAATQIQAAAAAPAAAPAQAAAARTPGAVQASVLTPEAAAVNNERRDAVTSKAALVTLGGEVAGAKKSGASAAAPIAKAFDGGVKTAGSAAASAVAAYGDFTPTRMSGLRHTGGTSEGENADFNAGKKPSAEATTPKPAPVEFEEFNFRRALAGFLVWLMLVGLVVLEYGAIYYAITHAPRVQPTPEEIQFQQHWDGNFPF